MSGSYNEYNPDVAESTAAVQSGVAAALSAAAAAQTEARRFVDEYGAEVIAGHADIGDTSGGTSPGY